MAVRRRNRYLTHQSPQTQPHDRPAALQTGEEQTTLMRGPGHSSPLSPIRGQLQSKLSSVRTQIDELQEEIVAALSILDEQSLVTVTELNLKVETLVKIERQLSIALDHRSNMENPTGDAGSPKVEASQARPADASPAPHLSPGAFSAMGGSGVGASPARELPPVQAPGPLSSRSTL